MRVAITSRIFAPEPSAASFRLEALATAFAEAGHDVTVLTVKPPKGLPDDDRGRAYRVRRFPVLRDRTGYVRGYVQYMSFDIPLFFRILFGKKRDLIITEPPPTTGFFVRLAAALRRTPYAYYAADVWSDAASQTGAPGWMVRAVRGLEHFALRGAVRVLSVSDGVTRRLHELGDGSSAVTVGNGVDTSAFAPIGPEFDAGGPTFVYAGTASEWHGAAIFVEAFARVRRDHPDARLVFIGGGSERGQIERVASEHGVEVLFRDVLPPAELAAWLRGAAASLASVKPGAGYDFAFPTKLYGSVAAGTPVIFTGAGPAREFVERQVDDRALGWACEYDATAVGEAMCEVIDNAPSTERRIRVSEWARAEVDVGRVAARIREELEEATAR